jgi:hypothetical protein
MRRGKLSKKAACDCGAAAVIAMNASLLFAALV